MTLLQLPALSACIPLRLVDEVILRFQVRVRRQICESVDSLVVTTVGMISVRNDQDVGDAFYDCRKLRISPRLIICCPGFQNHLNLREKVHWK